MPFVAIKMGRQLAAFSSPNPPDWFLTSRTSFALAARMWKSGSAKPMRDARRSRPSGSDRLERQLTDPAAAGQKA
jgi:hypothetical protein